MKKIISFALILFVCVSINAQEKGKFRLGGNLGLTIPPSGMGLSADLLDVRYNILDNLNVGLKFGGAYMIRNAGQLDESTVEATMHLNSNIMVVSDYYFNKGNSMFAPFVGAGVGSFSIYDLYFTAESNTQTEYSITELPSAQGALGATLRGGFEYGKFRMALEYYLIPKTKLYDIPNLNYVGMSGNNYLCLNIGFYFGGGRWNK